MEDGRRVFLTEDRSRAFDEFGEEVSQDAFDFDAVPYSAPTYEAFAGEVDLRNDLVNIEQLLTNERQNILDYQDQLDEARDRIADGNITGSELDELDANLVDAMPISVGRHMPGFEVEVAPNTDATLPNSTTTPTRQPPSHEHQSLRALQLR